MLNLFTELYGSPGIGKRSVAWCVVKTLLHLNHPNCADGAIYLDFKGESIDNLWDVLHQELVPFGFGEHVEGSGTPHHQRGGTLDQSNHLICYFCSFNIVFFI